MGEFVDYITSQRVHWARAGADFLPFFLFLTDDFSFVPLDALIRSSLIVLRFFQPFIIMFFVVVFSKLCRVYSLSSLLISRACSSVTFLFPLF